MSEQKQCRACDHPRESPGRYGCLRTSWSAMKAKAKLGCVTCGILSEGIEKVLHGEKSPADNDGDWQLRLDFNMHGAEKSLDIVVIDTGTVVTFFCSDVTPWLSKILPDLPVAFDVPRQTSSPESLAWVRQQIKECQRSHPACIGLDIRSTFPQRVLDVQANSIRLHQSQGEHEPYICLSHVWGNRPFLQTTKDNFAAHKKAIDFDSLPPTFQQAVRYTRQLGVRYLWIDSLCIIQDDPHDWEIQASSMALIFQDSFLVLSAARSPNAYGGLYAEFPSRCKTHTVEVQVATDVVAGTNLTTEKVYARRSLAHLNSGRFMNQWLNSWHTNTLLPTLTRGWIFQERFLAPRVLHFGPEELSWECLRHSTCQCTTPQSPQKANRSAITNERGTTNDSSTPDKIISKIDIPTWHKQAITRNTRPKSYYNFWAWMALARKPAAVTKNVNDELTACWHHLIEDYTKLQLTFEKDIFPAVSGLAHLMWTALDSTESPASRSGSNPLVRKKDVNKSHMMASNKYFAGLWSHSLHRDILWRVGNQITPRRPDKWRAPSWSWAAVKGAVEFLDQTEGIQPKCELLENVDCALAGIDNFGELVDVPGKNILVLKGTILSSGLSFKGAGSGSGLVENDEWKENLRAWEVMELDIFRGHLKNVWADDCDTERLGGCEQTVYCLLVGIKKSNALCFLILRRVKDSVTEAYGAGEMYQRIGVAEVFGGPAGPGSWKDRLFAGGNVQTVRIR